MDPTDFASDEERGVARRGLRRAFLVGLSVYMGLKWSATALQGSGWGSPVAGWLAVCADHPLRCAIAAGLASLALTSFVLAAGTARPGREEEADL